MQLEDFIPQEFKEKVWAELEIARQRSMDSVLFYREVQGYKTRCSKCSVPLDELNPDCKTCRNRHLERETRAGKRERKVRVYPKPPKRPRHPQPRVQGPRLTDRKLKGRCIGCGCDYNEYTSGCISCRNRHRGRRIYVRRHFKNEAA